MFCINRHAAIIILISPIMWPGLAAADIGVRDCEEAFNCIVATCGQETYTCVGDIESGPKYLCNGDSIDYSLEEGTSCTRLDTISCYESPALALISGRKRDIVNVFFNGEAWGSGVLETGKKSIRGFLETGTLDFPIRCEDDLQAGKDYFTIRYGRNLDLFWLVGLSDEGIIPLSVRLQDGDHLGVTHRQEGPRIKLGSNKDVHIQYCFDGKKWTSSGVHRGSATQRMDCSDDAIVFFNVHSTRWASDKPIRNAPRLTSDQIFHNFHHENDGISRPSSEPP